MEIINLGSIVDTLKINANFQGMCYEIQTELQDKDLEDKIESFNEKINELIILKKQAQEILSHDAQDRFIKTNIGGYDFNVMAGSTASYSLTLINGDISIYLRKFSKKVRNPVLKVEFRAEYLCSVGYLKAVQTVQRFIQHNFIENPQYRVNEIHLATDIQGYQFTPLDFYRIKTLSRKHTVFEDDERKSYFSNKRFTGMTFGKGDLMLRIYNKTKEITENKKKGFIQVLNWQHNLNFDIDLPVWRIEGQIRREKLKHLCTTEKFTNVYGDEVSIDINLDSLESVLSNIPSIWNLFISRFMHKSLTNEQIHEQLQGYKVLKSGAIKILGVDTYRKRFKEAQISNVWLAIKTFNGHVGKPLQKYDEITKPEVEYVENAYKALISTTTKLLRGNFNSSQLIQIIHNANDKFFNKKGMSILDNARINALDYLSSAKYYYEKNGVSFDGFDQYEKDMMTNLKAIVNPTLELQQLLELYERT